MRHQHLARLLGAAVVVLVVSGCGGGVRPSADELESAIRSGESGIGVSEEQAPCAAEVFVSSKLSDEMLLGYVTGADRELSEADRTEFAVVLDRLDAECGIEQAAG